MFNSRKDRAQRRLQLKQEQAELNWRRAQFLFEQARPFDSDPDIGEAIKIITGNNTEIPINYLFDFETPISKTARGLARHQLDKLLNSMERLAYAQKQGILTLAELHSFSWYFDRVCTEEDLRSYCEEYYPDIIEVGQIMTSDCEDA